MSNRVFNDIGQNVFSENAISQWGWAWGQFLDHDMGLRDETPAEPAAIPFVADDPLEAFTNDLGQLAFLQSLSAERQVVTATRRTPLAARLRAIYGDVGTVDAFVGMVSEAHVPGTEFGELQLAIWTKQFTSLRDGDRFFYANDRTLPELERLYGVTYQHTLADLIQLNSDATVPANVFVVG